MGTFRSKFSDSTTTQTHDFETFSQFLPFTPPKENTIRLFGKEFGSNDLATTSSSTKMPTINHDETKENGRTFECRYCCRNFTTSQALGGHQNAHRKERLHAKRTHNNSVMIHRSSSKPQLHSFPNFYHPYLTTTSSPSYYHHSSIRFLGGKLPSYISNQTPIDGRPSAPWRSLTAVQNSTTFNHGGFLNYYKTGSSSQSVYMHELDPSLHEQVSLDLHL